MLRWGCLLLSFSIGAIGCSSPSEIEDDDPFGEGGKEDRGGASLPSFTEVDGAHSTLTFRRYVGRALALLRDHDTEIGRLTYASITEQELRIDELVDLTCRDFRRAVDEMEGSGLVYADWAHLHDRNSPAAKKLTDEMNGYMWSNRIYVARGLTTQQLASTLVHETNHVLNHSEQGYFDDLPSSGFREEYRAFYAERQFDPTPFNGLDLVEHVAELYDYDRARLTKSLQKQPLSPRLLPDEEGWLDRDLAADPNEAATCPQ